MTLTRSLLWRRYLFADAPETGRLMRHLVAPPKEYLRWRWPEAPSEGVAWRRHMANALRN